MRFEHCCEWLVKAKARSLVPPLLYNAARNTTSPLTERVICGEMGDG